MTQLITFAKRNLKLYFRDKGAVFFSLLSMIIVIGLMVFFLGDMNVNNLVDVLSQFPNRDALADKQNAELIILTWTCAGILSINAVTVTLAVYSIMIKDKVNGKLNSFYTSPVSRWVIVGGYILSAFVTSVLVCILTLFLTEFYCVTQGMQIYSFACHLKLFLLIMVNSFTYASIMFTGAMFAKSEGGWSGFGTVIGTLVGFLGGIYIPIGALAGVVTSVMKCTPVIYATSMFRSVMMEDVLKSTFSDLPEQALTEYSKIMGISLWVEDHTFSLAEEWMILFGCGILFLVIGIILLKYSKKTDR